ncbi:hypothetical protein [Dyella sp.]|uniref:hypothetical protein n=1 Tax=Dyella sp. TaxID=1869338 RepID=UPI002847921A|nr:hypothetical protein [Dyella sp.]MDR3446667.1 hypothetical protein [Dyella sp.]
MSGHLIPHATELAQRVAAELSARGLQDLAAELEAMHRATCQLVEAIHAEREAPTTSLLTDARHKSVVAIRRLRAGSTA